MILILSLGFGLGVLACVAAEAVERGRRGSPCLVQSPRQRDLAACERVQWLTDLIDFQDSTLPENK